MTRFSEQWKDVRRQQDLPRHIVGQLWWTASRPSEVHFEIAIRIRSRTHSKDRIAKIRADSLRYSLQKAVDAARCCCAFGSGTNGLQRHRERFGHTSLKRYFGFEQLPVLSAQRRCYARANCQYVASVLRLTKSSTAHEFHGLRWAPTGKVPSSLDRCTGRSEHHLLCAIEETCSLFERNTAVRKFRIRQSNSYDIRRCHQKILQDLRL